MDLPPNIWLHLFIGCVLISSCLCADACDRSLGADCTLPGGFETGEGDVKLNIKIKCNDKPYYGAYVQLVDFFQAVNDVIAHGHTDLDGNVALSGKYFYYSDSDLPPPKYEYKIIVYHYCGVRFDRQNQCHQVGTYTSNIECTQKSGVVQLQMKCMSVDQDRYEKLPKTDEIDITKNQKLICLDGV